MPTRQKEPGMRIIVTGSDGFSGSHFCVQARNSGHQVLAADLETWFEPEGCVTELLDIRDKQACERICRNFRPDVVIHTARAPGRLGDLERDRAAAYDINVSGARNMAVACEELGATFVFLSSDWIFDGRRPKGMKYKEDDEPCPVNYYGVTKLLAELEIRRICRKWLIVRPAHFYGFHAALLDERYKGKMRLLDGTVLASLGNQLQEGKELRIVDALYQTPVLVVHLVETTLNLLGGGATGVFHVADREPASRYDVVRGLARALGFDADLVRKGSLLDFAQSQNIPSDLQNILPVNTSLDVGKVEGTLGRPMMVLEEGLAKMSSILGSSTR